MYKVGEVLLIRNSTQGDKGRPDRMKTKFRNASGMRLLRKLFFETSESDKSSVLYTLKDYDHEGYPSLYRLYMEASDLTEYDFACLYFENWDHWKLLTNSKWFLPFVARWREELDLKTKSQALKVIQREAQDKKSKNSFAANKLLIDRAWEKSGPKTKRGRPSTEEVQSELKRASQETARINGDYERIFGEDSGLDL